VTVARTSRVGMTLEEAAREFAAEVASGERRVSLRQIQTRCHTGRPRAHQIQTHLAALVDAGMAAPVDARGDAQARVREPVSL
jgi:hypothetical protein